MADLGGQGSPLFHTVHAQDSRASEQVYLVDAVGGQDAIATQCGPRTFADVAGLAVEPAEPGDAAPLLVVREAAAT